MIFILRRTGFSSILKHGVSIASMFLDFVILQIEILKVESIIYEFFTS